MKNKFIDAEFWSLTTGGAFQRANVYRKDLPDKGLENKKKEFKSRLREIVAEITTQYVNGNIDDEQHIENIRKIIKDSVSDILNDGKLKFGVAQKLLNLHLKYEWCRDKIPEPPHCPVDRVVLTEYDKMHVSSWTKMDSEEEYRTHINHLRTKFHTPVRSLAMWELEMFSRRFEKEVKSVKRKSLC